MALFRFLAGDTGIYEAVERDCPRSDPRRSVKPDGSWLPKAGEQFPGAVSYWKAVGLEKYIQSGLQDWHRAVAKAPSMVRVSELSGKPLYEDELQVIAFPEAFSPGETFSADEFFLRRAGSLLVEKVAVYLTRDVGHGPELLLFVAPETPDPVYQVPAGTLEKGEDILAGALRELEEESGVRVLSAEKFHETVFFKKYSQQFQRRHCFHVDAGPGLPEGWEHRVEGEGEDMGIRFEYSWFPLSDLPPSMILVEGVADTLQKLEARLG